MLKVGRKVQDGSREKRSEKHSKAKWWVGREVRRVGLVSRWKRLEGFWSRGGSGVGRDISVVVGRMWPGREGGWGVFGVGVGCREGKHNITAGYSASSEVFSSKPWCEKKRKLKPREE